MAHSIRSSTYLLESISKHIDSVWTEIGIEPEYRDAVCSAFSVRHPAATSSSHESHRSLLFTSLPSLCCEAAGGDSTRAEDVTVAWRLLYTAAHLLDTVEDAEPEAGLLSALGPARTINVATGLIAGAGLALNRLEMAGVEAEVARAIRSDFYQTGLRMCAGQHRDLTLPEATLEDCWRIAEDKSGAFFALAGRVGARLATGDAVCVDRFAEFGYALGILIQIGDDVGGLWPQAGEPSDLAGRRRWTLPVAYAMSVVSPHQAGQLRLHLEAAPSNARAEAEARRQIIESGAALYLTIEAEQHCHRAEKALMAAAQPSSARDELLSLLHRAAVLNRT